MSESSSSFLQWRMILILITHIVGMKLDSICQVRVKCSWYKKDRDKAAEGGAAQVVTEVTQFSLLEFCHMHWDCRMKVWPPLVQHGSKSTIYRDVMSAGKKARKLHDCRQIR